MNLHTTHMYSGKNRIDECDSTYDTPRSVINLLQAIRILLKVKFISHSSRLTAIAVREVWVDFIASHSPNKFYFISH